MQNGNPNNQQQQPYVSWKPIFKTLLVPGNQRPETNNNHTPLSYTVDANAFRARPIKHWRKQLIPSSGSAVKNVIYNDRPGSAILGNVECCDSSSYKIISDKSTLQNNYMDCSQTGCYTITADDISNGWNGPVGKRLCCNPVSNRIRSATTLLNKKYYTDSRAYLKSRCKLYDQQLSGTPYPGVTYFDDNGRIILPNNNNLNTSLRSALDCSAKCSNPQKTIYKPNNSKYATQGSVSSSSRITRLKLDTITSNASSFRSAYGAQSSNAGRYTGSMTAPYFVKSKYQNCSNNITYCSV